MLRANDIVPRNPDPLQVDPLDALPTPETSSGIGDHSKAKREIGSESDSDSEIEDEDSMREKALLVGFRFHVLTVLSLILPG
jgi:hypothetical protein